MTDTQTIRPLYDDDLQKDEAVCRMLVTPMDVAEWMKTIELTVHVVTTLQRRDRHYDYKHDERRSMD